MSGFEIETKDNVHGTRIATLPGWAAVPAPDSRWMVWRCSSCGTVEAGYNVEVRKLACGLCVARVRENKAIGLTPEALWREAIEDAAKAKLCTVCGEKAGPAVEELMRGQSVVCRSCVAGAAA